MSESAGGQPIQAPATPRRTAGRSAAAIICLVLAALLTTPAAVAFWGQRTLNDTQRYVDTVGPLVDSPAVQDAIATKVTDAIQTAGGRRGDHQPGVRRGHHRPPAAAEAGRAAVGRDQRADRQPGPLVRRLRHLRRPLGHGQHQGAAGPRARPEGGQHRRGLAAGRPGRPGCSDVIDQVKQRLVARGLTFVENVPIPDVDKQIVLFDAPQLKQARTIYAFANPMARWLIVVVAGLFLAAFLLARRRPRMTVTIGVVLAANALLVALALSIGRQLFIDHLAGTVFGPASSVFYDTLLAYLVRGWQMLFWLGLILVVAGWFTGSNAPGTAVRSSVRHGLEGVGAQLADGPVSAAGRWVAGNARWLRVAVGVIGVVVLLWGNDISPSRLLWSLVLVLVLLAVVQVLVGAGGSGAMPQTAAEGESKARDPSQALDEAAGRPGARA